MFERRLAWFCGKPGLMLRKLPWSPIFDLTVGWGFDIVDLIEKQSETGGFATLTESFSYIITLSKLCTCLTSGTQPCTERVSAEKEKRNLYCTVTQLTRKKTCKYFHNCYTYNCFRKFCVQFYAGMATKIRWCHLSLCHCQCSFNFICSIYLYNNSDSNKWAEAEPIL